MEMAMMVQQSRSNYAIWWRIAGVTVALILLVRLALGVWSTFTPPTATRVAPAQWNGATQTSEGGQVTIKVVLQDTSGAPTFKITMDTHAVDLDGYDLERLAVLQTDQGQTVQPTEWDAPKGGHHREGTLTFPATAANGNTLIRPETRRIELVIRDVAGVPERTLTWTR
jgi:hypothetical protein